MAAPAAPSVTLPVDSAAPDEAEAKEAGALYERVRSRVAHLFEAAAMETISPGRLQMMATGTEEIAAELARAPGAGNALLVMALGTYPEGEGFVVPHSANVAILAAYVGQELGLSRARLTDTCLAGLTHDLGNVKLANGILYKEGPLSPQEWEDLRKRPSYSREILASLGGRYRAAAEIAHQVYERMDGSGYPGGIEGEQILPEARILGAVDFFETVVHPRPYEGKPAGGVTYGLQTLMRMAGQFGQDTLKALVRSVGLFPVGTWVLLSTGEVARVLRTSRGNPMRPVVDVFFDKRKRRPEPFRRIDLLATPHLYISKSLSQAELEELELIASPRARGEAATGESSTQARPNAGTVAESTLEGK
jgi:HD-GYP domain-containing protein (c-di-GMP phosphodiesterase class II)